MIFKLPSPLYAAMAMLLLRASLANASLLTAGANSPAASDETATVFHITETDNGLITDIPGAIISGTQDDWIITTAGDPQRQVTTLWSFETSSPPIAGSLSVTFSEPESPPNSDPIKINRVTILPAAASLHWQSDVPLTADDVAPVESAVIEAVENINYIEWKQGRRSQRVPVILSDQSDQLPVPDAASSFQLLALSLVILSGFAWVRGAQAPAR